MEQKPCFHVKSCDGTDFKIFILNTNYFDMSQQFLIIKFKIKNQKWTLMKGSLWCALLIGHAITRLRSLRSWLSLLHIWSKYQVWILTFFWGVKELRKILKLPFNILWNSFKWKKSVNLTYFLFHKTFKHYNIYNITQ